MPIKKQKELIYEETSNARTGGSMLKKTETILKRNKGIKSKATYTRQYKRQKIIKERITLLILKDGIKIKRKHKETSFSSFYWGKKLVRQNFI